MVTFLHKFCNDFEHFPILFQSQNSATVTEPPEQAAEVEDSPVAGPSNGRRQPARARPDLLRDNDVDMDDLGVRDSTDDEDDDDDDQENGSHPAALPSTPLAAAPSTPPTAATSTPPAAAPSTSPVTAPAE